MINDNLEQEKYIEKYFEGKLNSIELADFEKRLSSDPVFAEEVTFHKLTKQVAKLYEPVYFKNLLIEKGNKNERKKKVRIIYLRAIAASIVLVLIAGGYFFLDYKYSNEGILNQFRNPLEIVDFRRSSRSDEQGNYIKGLIAYENKDYEKAIKLLINSPDSIKISNDYKFILSNALLTVQVRDTAAYNILLQESPYTLAIKYLKELKDSPEYRERAKWYLALAYLANNQIEDARNELEIIISDDSNYKTKAKSLLRKLNSPLLKLFS